MYALYEPHKAAYKESQSRGGLARLKYDKEHKDSLEKYPEMRERMYKLLNEGKRITPKQWRQEIKTLQAEYDSISREQAKAATELAYAEVISRELQNEGRQQNKMQSRWKRREEL